MGGGSAEAIGEICSAGGGLKMSVAIVGRERWGRPEDLWGSRWGR